MSEKSEQHPIDGTFPLLAPFQDHAEHLHAQSTTNPTLSEQSVPDLVALSAKPPSSAQRLFDTGINLEILLDREINALSSSSELFAVPNQETYEEKEPASPLPVAVVPSSSPVASAPPSSSSPSQPSALFSTLWMGSAGLPVSLDEPSSIPSDTDGTLSEIPMLRFLPPTDSTDHHDSWSDEANHRYSWPEKGELSHKDTPHDQDSFSPDRSPQPPEAQEINDPPPNVLHTLETSITSESKQGTRHAASSERDTVFEITPIRRTTPNTDIHLPCELAQDTESPTDEGSGQEHRTELPPTPETGTSSQPHIEEYSDEVLFSGSYQDLGMLSARSAFHSFRPIPSPEPTSQPSIPSLSAAKPASTTETQHTALPDTTPTQTQPSYREPQASPSGPNYLETSMVTPFPKALSFGTKKPPLTDTAEMDLSPDHLGNQWEQEAPMSTTTQDPSLHTSSYPSADKPTSAKEVSESLSLSSMSVQESSDPILYSTFTESFTISAQEKNMQLPSAWQAQLKPLTHESFELEPRSISPPPTEARSSVLFLLLLILFSVIAISVWLLTALYR